MAWRMLAILAVPAMLGMHVPEPPSQPAGVPIARQRLGGTATGSATADVSADGHIVAFVSLARLTPADENSLDDVYVFERTISNRVATADEPRKRKRARKAEKRAVRIKAIQRSDEPFLDL